MRRETRQRLMLTVLFAGWFCGPTAHAQKFNYNHSDGCAHVVLYGWNDERNEVIMVRADREQLGLRSGTTRLTLKGQKGLEAHVDLYSKPLSTVDYCTDVIMPNRERPVTTLRASSGQITITIDKPGAVKGKEPFMYDATVTIRDASFKRPDGTIVFVKGPITLKAIVGYVWG